MAVHTEPIEDATFEEIKPVSQEETDFLLSFQTTWDKLNQFCIEYRLRFKTEDVLLFQGPNCMITFDFADFEVGETVN